MRKFLLNLFLIAFVSLLSGQAYAQCTNNTTAYWTAAAPTALNVQTTLTTCHYLSEYSTITGCLVGGVYEFTMTSISTPAAYITVTDGPGGTGNIIAHGPSPLTVVATAATIYPHWNLDASCAQQTTFDCETGTIEYIAAPASCIQPISLTASNFTTTSADLAWGDPNTTPALNYDIEVVPANGSPTGTPSQAAVSNPYTYTGLLPGISYDYYVRGHCSATDSSAWAGPFTFTTLATCQAPTNLTVTNITASGADLGWTENNTPPSTMWDIEIGLSPLAPSGTPVIPNITTNPYTLTGLPPNTTFDFYVRSQCAVNSGWTGPFTFTTLCVNATANATTSYCEDFTVAPNCWANAGGSLNYIDTAGYAHAPMWASPNGSTWIYTTHLIELDAAMLPQLSFDWSHLYDPTYPTDAFDVEISNDGGATWTNILNLSGPTYTTPGATNQAPAPLPWSNSIVPLTAYAGDTVMFRYTTFSGWGPDVYLDNICIEQQPSCVDPVSLTAVPTSTTATLGWTDNNATAPMGWLVSNQLAPGTAPTGAAGVYQAGATPSYNAMGLTPVTNYEFYVRAVCSVGDSSAWVGPFAYTTTATCVAATLGTAATTPTSAVLSWTDNNVAPPMGWMIDQDTSGVALGAGVYQAGGTPTTFNATGLAPNSVYRFYVRAVCSGTDSSAWAGPFVYQTPCVATMPPTCEDFSTMAFSAPPSCWSTAGDGTPLTGPSNFGTSIWTNRNFANIGTNQGAGINLYQTGNEEWLISPQYDMTATGGPFQAEYDFGIWDYFANTPGTLGSDDEIQFLISTDGGATWNNVKTWNASSPATSAPGDHEVLDLSAYTTGTVMFAFYGTDGTVGDINDNDIMVDNFCVVPIPSCYQPYAQAASNITLTTADLDWLDSNTAPAGFEVEVTLAGIPPTGTGIYGVTNPYTITGLTPSTCYDYYVRTVCGPTDSSLWTGPFTFCTACAPDSVSVFNAKGTFTGGGLPTCWTLSGPENWLIGTGFPDYSMFGVQDHTTGTNQEFAWVDGSGTGTETGITMTSNTILNFDIAQMTTPFMEFYVASESKDNGQFSGNNLVDNNILKVYVSYDGGTTFVLQKEIQADYATNGWYRVAFELDKTALGTNDLVAQFVIDENGAVGNAAFYNDILIDDIAIKDGGCASYVTAIATVDTVADCECTDLNGWTHYSNEASSELLLSVQKDSANSPSIVSTMVHVQGAATGATNVQPTAANPPGYVTTTYYAVMNRYWDVNPEDIARQPAGPTDVRFYYGTTDFTSLQSTVTGLGGTLATHTDMVAYKIDNDKDPNPVNGHATVLPADYNEYNNAGAASLTDWAYSVYGTDHQIEYLVNSFSGGGGGFGPSTVGGALPITLTKFVVNKEGSVSMALWTTTSEQNNSHFNLQRSTDGNLFKTLGKVNSKAIGGTSNIELDYNFADQTPQIGHNYYRLQQVDIDGNMSYSEIIDVVWGADGSVVSVYPNPTTDKLNVDIATDKVQQLEVRLLDMSGRVVKSIVQRTQKGMNNVTFTLAELPAGVYGVQIFENNKMTHVSKVRKN